MRPMLRPMMGTPVGAMHQLKTLVPTRPDWWPNPPLPPATSNYTIPGGATVVSDQAGLATALAAGTAQDIKLLNGTYSNSGPITPATGHRLWAESVGGVVLDYGLMWGNKTGWEVHGITFTITSSAKVANNGDTNAKTGALVNFTSGASNSNLNMIITDCTIDISHQGRFCIYLGTPGGAIVKRCVLKNAEWEGAYLYNNAESNITNWINSTVALNDVSDLDVSGIYVSAARGTQDGKDEYGVTIGHKVTNGVRRIKCRDIGWGGMLVIGKCLDTEFSDLDMDIVYGTIPIGSPTSTDDGYFTGQAVYLERACRRNTFSRFRFGPDIQRAFALEWDEDKSFRLTSSYTIGATQMFMDFGNFALLNATGTVYMGLSENGAAVFYTGIDAGNKKLTGCTGGTGGPYAIGTLVAPFPGGRHAATDVVIKEGVSSSEGTHGEGLGTARTRRGISMDDGTLTPTIRDVIIRGPKFYAGVPSNNKASTMLDNTNVPATLTASSAPSLSMLSFDYVDGCNGWSGYDFISYS